MAEEIKREKEEYKEEPETVIPEASSEAKEVGKKKSGPSSVLFRGGYDQVIWDPQNGKQLCKFMRGEYRTSDQREIDIIRRAIGTAVEDKKTADRRLEEIAEKNNTKGWGVE